MFNYFDEMIYYEYELLSSTQSLENLTERCESALSLLGEALQSMDTEPLPDNIKVQKVFMVFFHSVSKQMHISVCVPITALPPPPQKNPQKNKTTISMLVLFRQFHWASANTDSSWWASWPTSAWLNCSREAGPGSRGWPTALLGWRRNHQTAGRVDYKPGDDCWLVL